MIFSPERARRILKISKIVKKSSFWRVMLFDNFFNMNFDQFWVPREVPGNTWILSCASFYTFFTRLALYRCSWELLGPCLDQFWIDFSSIFHQLFVVFFDLSSTLYQLWFDCFATHASWNALTRRNTILGTTTTAAAEPRNGPAECAERLNTYNPQHLLL